MSSSMRSVKPDSSQDCRTIINREEKFSYMRRQFNQSSVRSTEITQHQQTRLD